VEVYSESYINLYDHNNKTPLRGGRCVITTHRLFYIKDNTNPPTALYLPLQSIVRITKEAGFLARSGKKLHNIFVKNQLTDKFSLW
jgi:hypothetical protein